ncbi:MAG: STAS domain-containing protein [Rubrobacteraceae bacterium]
MPAKQLEARVRRVGDTGIIDLRGEINALAQETLEAAYAEVEKENPEVILLNFEEVDYINSTGIALIVSLLAKARATGRRMLACNLSDHYVEIFNITRLSDFMNVFDDEQSALQEVAS